MHCRIYAKHLQMALKKIQTLFTHDYSKLENVGPPYISYYRDLCTTFVHTYIFIY